MPSSARRWSCGPSSSMTSSGTGHSGRTKASPRSNGAIGPGSSVATQPRAQRFGEDAERGRGDDRDSTREHGDARLPSERRHLSEKARLADAAFAHQHHADGLAGASTPNRPPEHLELAVAADDHRRSRCPHPRHAPSLVLLGLVLPRMCAWRLRVHHRVMSFEEVMPKVMQWSTAAEALGALGAYLTLQQTGAEAPPEVAERASRRCSRRPGSSDSTSCRLSSRRCSRASPGCTSTRPTSSSKRPDGRRAGRSPTLSSSTAGVAAR